MPVTVSLTVLVPVAIVVGAVALGLLVRIVLERLTVRWASRAGLDLVEAGYRTVRGLVVLWFALAGGLTAVALSDLPGDIRLHVDRVLITVLIFSLTLAATRLLTRAIARYASRVESGATVATAGQRVVAILIWIVGALTILRYLDVEITPLLTTLGVAGLATALALQDTLANFFAGFYILADRPIRLGDYVRLDSGVEGYVVEIGWRSSKIRTLQYNVVIIPNQKVAQSVITNYYLPEPRLALAIPVSVGYDSDPDRVEQALLAEATAAVGEVPGLLGEPAPAVRLIPGFGANSLDFTLSCHVREFSDQGLVQHELRKRILRRLRAEGIEIGAPVQRVRLADGEPSASSRQPSAVSRQP